MKSKIISFVNHKGGVGKTTTTMNVGSILARRGYKVLLVDLDSQANLTNSLLEDRPTVSSSAAFISEGKALPVIALSPCLDLVPADIYLSHAQDMMQTRIGRESILADLLQPLEKRYDFILLDCSPGIGLLVLNALTASQDVIIPMYAEKLSEEGLRNIVSLIGTIRKKLNGKLRFSGILFTRWESSNNSRAVFDEICEDYPQKVFSTRIRKNVRLAEAPRSCQSIIDYAPKSNGALDYLSFTDELLERLGIKKNK